MKIVIGLGNPEPKYLKTLHNLGFMTADVLADRLGASFTKKPKLKSLVAETSLAGEKVLIVKPLTYMNLSGEAVVAVRNFYKVPEKDCLIIYDDLDLKIGTIRYRIRQRGNAQRHAQHSRRKRNERISEGKNRVGERKPVYPHNRLRFERNPERA